MNNLIEKKTEKNNEVRLLKRTTLKDVIGKKYNINSCQPFKLMTLVSD
jgi:hypothetical protein